MFLHSFLSASPRTSDCPRHEYLPHCTLFLALNLMLIVCLHLFAIQSEILFVLPENTLLHVACIYPLTSHNNQCITFSPLRRLWLADYHQKCLIIKWNETTVFLSFSVISVPKCGPGLCLLIIYWKHSYKISRQRPNAKMKMCSGGGRKDTCT